MRSVYKNFSDKFLSKSLLKKLNLTKKKFLISLTKTITGDFTKLTNYSFYNKVLSRNLTKKKQTTKRKKKLKPKVKTTLLSNLTKKQKKRVKVNKLHKLIRPSSPVFYKFKKYPRSSYLSSLYINKRVLIHDGYSWHLFALYKDFLNYKAGFLCFKTRALSPIDLFSKGKKKLKMAQKNTFKIKTLKIKRKK